MPGIKLRDKFSVDKVGDTLFVADKREWPEAHAEGFIHVYAVKQDHESSASSICGDTDYDKLAKYLTTDYCERNARRRIALVISSNAGVVIAFICLALGLTWGDPQIARLFSGLCIATGMSSYFVSESLDSRSSRLYRAFPPQHVLEERVDRALIHWGGAVIERDQVAQYVHSKLDDAMLLPKTSGASHSG